MKHWGQIAAAALLSLVLLGLPAIAQQFADAPALGPETNLPVPRFVSLNAAEANVRRGPSLSHRIDWVFKRRNMPLQLVAEYDQWRRVIDRDGQGGWIHYSLLSGARMALVELDQTPLRARPDPAAAVTALLETGVIGRLGACDPDWCNLSAGGFRGWVPKSTIWGVTPEELRD